MWNVQQTGTVSAGGSGVPSVNGITSAVTIAGGTGISVGTAGGTVTITNTGGGTSPGVPTVTFLNGTAGTLSTGYTDFSGTITFTTGVTNPNDIFSLTFGGTYSTPLSCGAQVNEPFESSAQRQIYATTNPASTSVNFVSYTTNPLTLNALDVGNKVSWWCIPTGVISGGGGACMTPQQVVVSSATPTITFSSIPATCTDLTLTYSGQTTGSTFDNVNLTFNGDTSGDYDWYYTYIGGSNSGTASDFCQIGYTGVTGNSFQGQITATIGNYAGSVFNKSLTEQSFLHVAGEGLQQTVGSCDWYKATPVAITSITLTSKDSANFAVGTTVTLRGQ
jgi:hypothetical protein